MYCSFTCIGYADIMWFIVSSNYHYYYYYYYQFNDDTMQHIKKNAQENMHSELKKSNRIIPLPNLNKCVNHDQSDTEVYTNDISENNSLKNTTIM